MSFSTKTLDELHELYLAHLRGRVPGASIAKGSDLWLKGRAMAAVAFVQQQQDLDTARNILPSTADPNYLPEHARVRMGDAEATLPAAAASGLIMVLGDAAAITIPTGATLTHANGQKYKVTLGDVTVDYSSASGNCGVGSSLDRVVVTPDASGFVAGAIVQVGSGSIVRVIRDVLPEVGTPYLIDFYTALLSQPTDADAIVGRIGCVLAVEAVAPGEAGNLSAGDVLTLDSPPAGITATVVVLEMTGGGDIETTDQQRRRVLAWMQDRPGSGNRADYRAWVREAPGVRIDDAFVYVGYRGVGTIDIVPFGVSGARQTGTTTNDKIDAYLGTVASEFDDRLIRQLIDGAVIPVTMHITVGEDFAPDWDPATTKTVDTGSTVDVVKVTTAPASIPIGGRVLVYVADGVQPGLYQRVVAAKDGSSITLDKSLPAAPTAGSEVNPGGPVTQAVIDAINALFDALTPGDPAGAQRFPTPVQGGESTLRPEQLSRVALEIEGVEGCFVDTPTDVEAPAQFSRLRLGSFRISHA